MGHTTLQLAVPWERVKEKIKERNPHLADDDLQYEPGNEDALLEKLAGIMHRSKEEVKDYIESISQNKGMAS
ncbi:MAG: hypothetical protein QM731_19610 [Chitinophagaceae bacterium]